MNKLYVNLKKVPAYKTHIEGFRKINCKVNIIVQQTKLY